MSPPPPVKTTLLLTRPHYTPHRTPTESAWPSSARWRPPACSYWWQYQTCRDRRSRWSCSPSLRSRQCQHPWPGSHPPQTRAQWTLALGTRRGLERKEFCVFVIWWLREKKNWSIRADKKNKVEEEYVWARLRVWARAWQLRPRPWYFCFLSISSSTKMQFIQEVNQCFL